MATPVKEGSFDEPIASLEATGLMDGRLQLRPSALASARPPPSTPGHRRRTVFSFRPTRYPITVVLCLVSEFAERFAFYGMRAVLVLFFVTVYGASPSTAKLTYHAFISLAYVSPMIGSVLADSYFGRYALILSVSVFYCAGLVMVTVATMTDVVAGASRPLMYIGLAVVALSTGGIKPCVSTFAADQFSSDRAKQRSQFFSFFYLTINVGALLASVVVPYLRSEVSCCGQNMCFPLAMGVPAIFMFLAAVVFFAGHSKYVKVPPERSAICQVYACICRALRERRRQRKNGDHDPGHPRAADERQPVVTDWLDYAKPIYDQRLVDSVRRLLRLSVLFLPAAMFWTLFDQMSSSWVLQANTMNGRVGTWRILSDQMSVLNPAIVILFVPVLEGFIYPFLARYKLLVNALQRMICGLALATLSFLCAGFLQLYLSANALAHPDAGSFRLTVVNLRNCTLVQTVDGHEVQTVPSFQSSTANVARSSETFFEYGNCSKSTDFLLSRFNSAAKPPEGDGDALPTGVAFVFWNSFDHPSTVFRYDLPLASKDDHMRLHVLVEDAPNAFDNGYVLVLQRGHQPEKRLNVTTDIGQSYTTSMVKFDFPTFTSDSVDVFLERCDFLGRCPRQYLSQIPLHMSATALIAVQKDRSVSFVTMVPGNVVSILWQVPQFALISIGELLFSISGLDFAYSQADASMKSIVTALWLLTVFLGNICTMLISGVDMFPNASLEFFTYVGLMLIVLVIFTALAKHYHYVEKSRFKPMKR